MPKFNSNQVNDTEGGKKKALSAVKNHPAKTGTDLDVRLVIIKLNKQKQS